MFPAMHFTIASGLINTNVLCILVKIKVSLKSYLWFCVEVAYETSFT